MLATPPVRRRRLSPDAKLGAYVAAFLAIAAVGGLILSCLVFAALTHPASAPVSPAAPSAVVPKATATPPDINTLLHRAIDNGSGGVRVSAVTLIDGNLQVSIAATDGVLGKWEVEGDVYKAMHAAYTESDIHPQSVTITYFAQMMDKYGNTVMAEVAIVTLTSDTAAQFNWDAIGITGAWNAYDSTQASPNL